MYISLEKRYTAREKLVLLVIPNRPVCVLVYV